MAMLYPRNAAAVREPSNGDLEKFRSLGNVIRWAGLTGDLDYRFSQAGSLLFLLGAAGAEFDGGVASAADFASISPEDYEDTIHNWMYSVESTNGHNDYDPDLGVKPNAIVRGRVRAAHRCAHIWQHLEWSSQACTQYRQWKDEKSSENIRAAPPVAAQPSGDMVRMHGTVDVATVR